MPLFAFHYFTINIALLFELRKLFSGGTRCKVIILVKHFHFSDCKLTNKKDKIGE